MTFAEDVEDQTGPHAADAAQAGGGAGSGEGSAGLSLCLFGAAGDTGNLGVSALLHATLGAIAERAPSARVTVFDNGWGLRTAHTESAAGRFDYELCGARLSRRLHRPESFWNMRVAARLGGLRNPGARRVLAADAVWDVSGGDSFSDLYGAKVLEAIACPKELALERGVPLVLLPQTYGPFRTEEARTRARRILCGASLAWARDERSFVAMRELLGATFDPERHRLGVDVAFLLRPVEPRDLGEDVRALLQADRGRPSAPLPPLIGINVSGLIYNDPGSAERYGLRANYKRIVDRLLRRFLEESDARVLLLPHVLVPSGAVESDADACAAAREALPTSLHGARDERVIALPSCFDQSGAKWILQRLDWFCGTRMHPCIGALSSGTPAASIAYSLKTKGVFETCNLGEHVLELRSQDEEEIVEGVWASWLAREEARATLAARLPEVVHQAQNQMDVMLAKSGGSLRPRGGATPAGARGTQGPLGSSRGTEADGA